MNTVEFEFLKKLLHEKSGLSIGPDKMYLLDSRLTPVATRWKMTGLSQLVETMRMRPDPKLTHDVVEAMTTNETLWFRDEKVFRHFRTNLLPAMLKTREKSKALRLWSAACSSGQEPYSVAMTLDETLAAQPGWRVDILATDIADSVVEQGRRGLYSQFEIQRGLPIQMMMKNFDKVGDLFEINEKFRRMVKFENFNLLDRMDRLGTFDIIFCRHVLIYFDTDTKRVILQNLLKRLAPDGYLFVGGSEAIIGLTNTLEPVAECPGLYRQKPFTVNPQATKPVIGTLARVN